MTSPANEMYVFLWQIGTVAPIQSMITHIYMPRFLAKSLAIAIVCGNYFRVFPRNLVFVVTHMFCLLKLIFPCLKLKQPFDVLLAVYQTGV
jgi:hypothetical protein